MLTAALALAIVLSAPLATAAERRGAPAKRGWWKSLVEAAMAALPNQLQCDLGPYIDPNGWCISGASQQPRPAATLRDRGSDIASKSESLQASQS